MWAAVACLAAGVVAPYAGSSAPLTLAFGDAPNPYLYVLSWFCLGLVGMLATNGFALYFGRRNRTSTPAGCVCLSLFAMSWLPVFTAIDSMRRAIATPGPPIADWHRSSDGMVDPSNLQFSLKLSERSRSRLSGSLMKRRWQAEQRS